MGEDKGLMLFDDKPMIQHVIDVVTPIVNEVIIIANDNKYNAFGHPVYEDIYKDKGPLAGIYTGLFYSNSEMNIVLSCDVPYVNSELISFLMDQNKNYEITIPKKNGNTHQLIGVFSKSCTEEFKKSLENNELKVLTAFEKLNLNVVDADQFDKKLFNNVNTKDDIEA